MSVNTATRSVSSDRYRPAVIATMLVLSLTAITYASRIVGGISPVEPPPPVSRESKSAPKTDTIKFFNGDNLQGKLLNQADNKSLRWQHPDTAVPIEFSTTNVSEVLLYNPATLNKSSTTNRVSVTLTNDDLLAGQLVSLDKDILVLDTTYAGRLNLQRAMVRRLTPNPDQLGPLYTGPNNMEEWSQFSGNSHWQYRDGELVCRGSGAIAKDVGLKDMVRIDFDLRWQQHLGFYFSFYAGAPNSRGNQDYYVIQFSGNEVYLQRADPDHGQRNVSGANGTLNLQNKASGHFTVLINKKEKNFSLLHDGELVKTWTDPNDFSGPGTWIWVSSSGNPIKVSNIQVSEWDGRLNLGSMRATGDEDTVVFSNNDKISGTIESILNTQIKLKTAYATLDIPINRVGQIVLSSGSAQTPRLRKGNIRATFVQGGGITFDLEKLDERTIAGSSDTFGSATFDRTVFNRLQFNLHDERQKSKHNTDEF